EDPRSRCGITVRRQDAVDRRAEPDQPAAQRERIDAKGLHEIVGSRFGLDSQIWLTRQNRILREVIPSPALREREAPIARRWQGERVFLDGDYPHPAAANAPATLSPV